nr:MAG TPA: hypothetical protein [Caudoviricetes sp.]
MLLFLGATTNFQFFNKSKANCRSSGLSRSIRN